MKKRLFITFLLWALTGGLPKTATGALCCQMAGGWTAPALSQYVFGLWAAADGYVYVPDGPNNLIRVYDSSGNPAPAPYGPAIGTLPSPYSVAVDSVNGFLYAGNITGQLSKYSLTSPYTLQWTVSTGASIQYLYLDNGGNVYMDTASSSGMVSEYSPSGTLLGSLTVDATGGNLNQPTGMWKVGNTFYVAEYGTGEILAYNEPGNLTNVTPTVVATTGAFLYQMWVSGSTAYVAEVSQYAEYTINADGTWALLGTSCPFSQTVYGITVDANQNVYLGTGVGGGGTVLQISCATPTATPTFTPTLSATLAPTGTSTPTATPTLAPANTPTDIFEVTRNILGPSGPPVSIYVNETASGNYALRIYNSAGEHIRTLDSQNPSGPVSQWYSWDGKNKHGDACASGVYFIYLEEPYSVKAKRILLIH